MKRLSTVALLLAFLVICTSCATAPPAPKERYFWPRLPERPRIEWLKAYSSEEDLDQGASSSLIALVAGRGEILTLERPIDIYGVGSRRLYVVDPALEGVVVFDLERRKVFRLVEPTDTRMKFKVPLCVATDPDGNVYVGDSGHKKIFVFNSSHQLVRSISIEPNMTALGNFYVDSDRKRIIISDPRAHKLCFLGIDGTFDRCIGSRGDGDGQFNFPGTVRMNAKGEIIVADVMNARLQIFDSEGKFLRKFGIRGDNPGEFQVIKGVGVDSEGHIYVSDGKAHTVSIFSDTGDYLLTVGGRFSVAISGKLGQGGFLVPQGIYFGENDHFYVVDQLNSRFQEFRYLSDEFIRKNPIPGYVGEGTSSPAGKGGS
ncbi:MAG: 6-bladed beta-propeller [candidate division WOR-3 bacterium]